MGDDHDPRIASGDDSSTPKVALTAAQRAKLAAKLGVKTRPSAQQPIVRRPDGLDVVPLSHPQELLWLLDQVSGGGWAYNAPEAVRFVGPIDLDALHQAYDALVAHNEILRTTYQLNERDEPMQVIGPPGPAEYQVVDLSELDPTSADARLQLLLRDAAERPFDLAVDPIMRVLVVRLSPLEHVVLSVLHHIAIDGWSRAPFWQQLGELYRRAQSGATLRLDPQPIEYADFALWQRERLEGGLQDAQLAFWRRELEGAPASLDLPTDRARPPVQSFQGAHIHRKFSPDLLQAIRDVGQREGCTLFMTATALFAVFLHKLSGQDDIVIGTPIANRNRTDLESIIGYFANTIALRTPLHGDPTFQEVLTTVRTRAIAALTHQEVPFGKVVIEVSPDRDLSRTPIFQALLVVHTEQAADRVLGEATGERLAFERRWSKFDITLAMGEHSDGLAVGFEYATDLFDTATVERMATQFEQLTRRAVEHPDLRISELVLQSRRDERDMLRLAEGPQSKGYPACLHELFEHSVAAAPEKVAIEFEDRSLTYRELNAVANALAAELVDVGVGPDVPVGICAPRGIEMIVGLIATLKAGGACLPLDPDYPIDRLAHMLADSEASVLISVSATSPHLSHLNIANEIVVDHAWPRLVSAAPDTPPLPITVTEAHLAYLVYTSGSTGKPKGVMLTHRGLVNHARAAIDLYGLNADDRVLQFCSTSFDISIEEIFPTLAAGATIVVRTESMPLGGIGLCDWLRQRAITVLDLPTAFWHEWVGDLQSLAVRPHDALRVVIVGGETANASTFAAWLSIVGDRVRWFNTYGPSEASVIATAYEASRHWDQDSGRELSIGWPINNSVVHILDSARRPAPIGVRGEIYLGGPGVARGYLNQPELTADRFVADPFNLDSGRNLYRTGDIGRRLPDGSIDFVGRADQQIKIRGFRIEPGEIETVLGEHSEVAEVVVVAIDDPTKGKVLVAYATRSSAPAAQDNFGATDDIEHEIRRFGEARLPTYMIPSAVIILDQLPRTPNGKIDTRALPKPQLFTSGSAATVPPRDDIERQLASMWCDVLGIDSVGIFESFFDVGGHSLLAVRLFAQIERRFGERLPLASLIQNQTIAQLSELLRNDRVVEFETLIALQPTGSGTPIFLVHGPVGEGIIYLDLVRRLGGDQPAYAFQDRGLDRTRAQFSSIPAMARSYVDELQSVQPHGPYVVGGFCMGGVVAFEMAHQLRLRGEEIATVLLIDAAPLGHLAGGEVYTTKGRIRTHLSEFIEFKGKQRWLHVWETSRNVGDRLTRAYWWKFVKARYLDKGKPLPKILHDVEAVNWRIGTDYVVPEFHGRVALLRKSNGAESFHERFRREKWEGLVGETFKVYDIDSPAVSHTTLLKEPHVRLLADAVRDALDDALARDVADTPIS